MSTSSLARGIAVLLALGLAAPAAHADTLPASPSDPVGHSRWVNPELGPWAAGDLDVEITKASSSIGLGGKISVAVRVRNTSSERIDTSKVWLRAQHGDHQPSVAGARRALVTAGSYPYPGPRQQVSELGASSAVLEPGQYTDVLLEIPTAPGEEGSFAITQPGFYPVAILASLEGTEWASISESSQRYMLSVLPEKEEDPAPLSLIYPISAEVPVLPGETGDAPQEAPLILEREVAEELAEGGRIASLLDAYAEATRSNRALHEASCLALDPQLVSALDRMSRGYSVAQERPSIVSKKRRMRDSWLADDHKIELSPGEGAEEAEKLLEKMSQLAQEGCVLSLPWANADINALAATRNEWLIREGLARGNEVLSQVLGARPLDNVIVSPSGYVTQDATRTLGLAADVGIEALWEATPRNQDGGEQEMSALDSTETPALAGVVDPVTGAVRPARPLNVLVADNTTWGLPKTQRFAQLGEGVRAVGYQSSLAATLMQAGEEPATAAYSSYDTRVDPRDNSEAARNATAATALRQDLQGEDPVLAVLPNEELLHAAGELLSSGAARPLGLEAYVTPAVETEKELGERVEEQGGIAELTRRNASEQESADFGTPFDDPTALPEDVILRARQQAEYIDDLSSLTLSDPALALTPYQFTAPLRWDLLRALSHSGRDAIGSFDAAAERSTRILGANRDTLAELRNSVNLLPPGNVYTRTSSSSPLLIVAQNGLPLPVASQIQFSGPEGAKLFAPNPLIIPAKGSITVTMTTELPDEKQNDLKLWLATAEGAAISHAVDISVRTKSGLFGGAAMAALVFAMIALILGRTFWRHRKARHVAGTHPSGVRPSQRWARPRRGRRGGRSSGDEDDDGS